MRVRCGAACSGHAAAACLREEPRKQVVLFDAELVEDLVLDGRALAVHCRRRKGARCRATGYVSAISTGCVTAIATTSNGGSTAAPTAAPTWSCSGRITPPQRPGTRRYHSCIAAVKTGCSRRYHGCIPALCGCITAFTGQPPHEEQQRVADRAKQRRHLVSRCRFVTAYSVPLNCAYSVPP